jgi:hypothetical protein
MFDEDGGGSLDEDEVDALARCLGGTRLTRTELDAAMAEMDEDGGGDVSFKEFYEWWQSQSTKGAGAAALQIDTSAGGAPYSITIVRFKSQVCERAAHASQCPTPLGTI